MPNIPAICNKCGTLFNSGIFISENSTASLKGNISGPCPNCNSMGTIPDGIYEGTESILKILFNSGLNKNQLNKIATIFKNAKNIEEKPEKILNTIKEKFEEEEFIQINSILGFLPKSNTELYAFLMIILTAIQLYMNNIDKDKIINEAVNKSVQIIQSLEQKNIQNDIEKMNKQGRNELCNCGSNKKYKRCCGQYI